MAEYYVFCDGSYNPQLNIGVGAILLLSSNDWEQTKNGEVFAIQTKVMPATSIARIELMTALWALSQPHLSTGVRLFTDSKMIEGLPKRRTNLEANHYKSKRSGLSLANADLYQQFFKLHDQLHPDITWISGHSPSSKRTEFQRVFSFVDQGARKALRVISLQTVS